MRLAAPSTSICLLRSPSRGYKIFSVDKPTPSKRGRGSIMYVKNSLNPIERKSMATCTMELISRHQSKKHKSH